MLQLVWLALQRKKQNGLHGDIAISYQFSWNAISYLVVKLGSLQIPAPQQPLLQHMSQHSAVATLWLAGIGKCQILALELMQCSGVITFLLQGRDYARLCCQAMLQHGAHCYALAKYPKLCFAEVMLLLCSSLAAYIRIATNMFCSYVEMFIELEDIRLLHKNHNKTH